MLFLAHKPTNLLIVDHNKVILTTPQQVLFTTLHFIEEFLSRELASSYPTFLSYSDSSFEALLGSSKAVQVYWTDWECKIQLRCYVSLNQEPIYSVIWEHSWKIYGDFRQYSPAKVKLIRTKSFGQEFSSCFMGEEQYILTNKRFVSYNHRTKKLSDIEWQHRDEQLSRLKQQESFQMKAYAGEHGWTILSISNLGILVRDKIVQFCIYHEGRLYVQQDVMIWIDQQGKYMHIYQVHQDTIAKLGEMEAFEGHFIGCTLTEDKLTIILYDFKELQVKNIRLVHQEENIEFQAKKREKERLKEAMKTSIHEPSLVNEYAFNPSTQPEESKQNIKSSQSSPNIQLALKASIEKLKEQMQKSFQIQKYNQQLPNQTVVRKETDEMRVSGRQSGDVGPLEEVSKIEIKEPSSFDPPQQPMEPCDRLFQEGESGMEWQHMESNYELNLESSDVVHELRQPSNDQLFNHSNHQPDFAETPAFNTLENNNWEYAKDQWNIEMSPQKDPAFEKRPSRQIDNEEKPSSVIGKSAKARKITDILGDIYKRDPDKFDEALENAMDKVIAENEARIFLADHIRILNPSLTRDRLLRLYRRIVDNEQNRRLMGRALSEFRLQEVPLSCLPLKKEILNIFQKIYPTVYVEDLLKPTLTLIQEFIQSYFSKSFTGEILQIEDQSIELIHPRNLLNVILYLNDDYQIPLESIFQLYIKKMIRHHQMATLNKIKNSDVCEICGVDPNIFQKVAQSTIKEILEETGTKTQQIEDTLILTNIKTRKTYTQILSLICYFNQFDVKFNIQDLFRIHTNKNSQEVMKKIIQKCPASSLSKLSLPFVFQSLGRIQQEKTPIYYENWQIQLSKEISETLLKARYYRDAISILFPLAGVLKRSFAAKLLIKYMNGKFANRLACPRYSISDIINQIFRMILQNSFRQLQGDAFPEEADNQQWLKFCKICQEKLLYSCWQLAYIIYHDRGLSKELVNQEVITTSELQQMMKVGNFCNKKASTNGLDFIPKTMRIPLLFEASLHQTNESVDINQSESPKSTEHKFLLQQSFRGFDVKSDEIKQQINRSVRYSDTLTDPALLILKLSVERQSIITALRQIYEQFPRQKFIKALSLVDREKVQLHNVELFKSLANSHISYPFQRIIPFQYFLGETDYAWNKIKGKLITELNHQNFWVFYLLIDIIFSKKDEITQAFIQRVIYYEMDDEWHQQIADIAKATTIKKNKFEELRQAAIERNLIKIASALTTNRSNNE